MATAPTATEFGRLCLTYYSNGHAAAVASWVRDERELLWLAPATVAPLTAEKVDGWSKADQHRFVVWESIPRRAAAYVELDYLTPAREQMWVGHLVIAPALRGRGLSVVVTDTLLEMAFDRFGARQVLLLVFPENTPAVRCYERVGFRGAGEEIKHFEHRGRSERLLRMAIDRGRYRRLSATRSTPRVTLPFVAQAGR